MDHDTALRIIHRGQAALLDKWLNEVAEAFSADPTALPAVLRLLVHPPPVDHRLVGCVLFCASLDPVVRAARVDQVLAAVHPISLGDLVEATAHACLVIEDQTAPSASDRKQGKARELP